jgi:hypothetical protein
MFYVSITLTTPRGKRVAQRQTAAHLAAWRCNSFFGLRHCIIHFSFQLIIRSPLFNFFFLNLFWSNNLFKLRRVISYSYLYICELCEQLRLWAGCEWVSLSGVRPCNGATKLKIQNLIIDVCTVVSSLLLCIVHFVKWGEMGEKNCWHLDLVSLFLYYTNLFFKF